MQGASVGDMSKTKPESLPVLGEFGKKRATLGMLIKSALALLAVSKGKACQASVV